MEDYGVGDGLMRVGVSEVIIQMVLLIWEGGELWF